MKTKGDTPMTLSCIPPLEAIRVKRERQLPQQTIAFASLLQTVFTRFSSWPCFRQRPLGRKFSRMPRNGFYQQWSLLRLGAPASVRVPSAGDESTVSHRSRVQTLRAVGEGRVCKGGSSCHRGCISRTSCYQSEGMKYPFFLRATDKIFMFNCVLLPRQVWCPRFPN